MKLLSSHFVAPVALALLSVLAGCSSDNSVPPGTSGASPGGASSGGKSGSAGSSGGSVSGGGAGAGGSAGIVGVAGSAGAGTAGAGTAGAAGGTSVPATFATVKSIISMSCFGNGCHGQEGNPLQMTVTDDAKLYTTLLTHMTATCGAMVNKANPAESAIVKLLKGPCNGTDRMPYQMCFEGDTDYPCVTPDNIAAIQAWIANGAPQQ